jgi:hypothetical protein
MSGNNSGYGDYQAADVIISKGEVTRFTLTPRFNTSGKRGFCKIWIDMNNDGDFRDAGEQVYNASVTTNAMRSGTFTVPATAIATTTRMRVSMRIDSAQADCGGFRYGEVEDYGVRLSSCGSPSGLTTSGVTTTDAVLSWNPVPNVASYNLRYRRNSSATWINANTTGNSFRISGLSQLSIYAWQVQAVCGSGTSAYVAANNFTTPEGVYCTSKGVSSFDEWIGEVSIGSYLNISGSNGGYGDFTPQMINISKGVEVSCALTPGYRFQSYPEYWRIWIDLNGDKDYDDADEMVYSSNGSYTSKIDFKITVPVTATATLTRMRISMRYSDERAAPNACGEFHFGEVEEYGVNLTRSACGTPAGLSVSIPTSSSATLTWNPVPSAVSYPVSYRETGTTTWITMVSPVNSANISGLSLGKTYEWMVGSYCSVGSGATVPGPNFSTGYCTSTGNTSSLVYTENIDIGTQTISYKNGSGSGDYTATNVELNKGVPLLFDIVPSIRFGYSFSWKIWIDLNGDIDFSDPGELVYASNGAVPSRQTGRFTIPMTATATRTRMRVSMKPGAAQTECEVFEGGDVGDYVVTLVSCGSPSGLTTRGVTLSGATLSWGAAMDATSYKVRYRRVRASTWNEVTTTQISSTINELLPSTTYEWQVASTCALGTGNYVAGSNFTTPGGYCTSSGKFSVDDFNHTIKIGKLLLRTFDNGGYLDNTDTSVVIQKGRDIPFLLRNSAKDQRVNLEYWRIWIDLNGDKDFYDAGELVYDPRRTNLYDLRDSFNIPLTRLTTTEPTRMRIGMRADQAPDPCGTFELGEVEDYTVYLTQTCDTPVIVSAVNSPEAQQAIMTWRPVPGATSYEFAYREYASQLDWTSVTTNDTSYGIPYGLDPNRYEWKVRAVCNGGTGMSMFAVGKDVSTNGTCTDAYEFNDFSSEPLPIPINAEIKALICPGDADNYGVTTTQAEPKLMAILTELPADYTLYVGDSNSYAQSRNGGLTPDTVVYNATNANSYLVRVSGAYLSAYSTEPYTLRVFARSTDWPMPRNQKIGYRENAKTAGEAAAVGADVLKVWPNPASRNLSVGYRSGTDGAARMMVMDLSGRMVASRPVTLVAGANSLELDVSSLADGMYIVRVQTDSQSHSAKVQVMK